MREKETELGLRNDRMQEVTDEEGGELSLQELTPMLGQYRRLKQRHPDALLLYRLGDFYELFEDDARAAARVLGLVLTSRRFSKKVRLAMCGVPFRSVTGYVARLLQAGHKVAIAEQIEDARRTKGLVKRDIVRIITPGTVVEEDLLPDKGQNLLVAVVAPAAVLAAGESDPGPVPLLFGLAVVDLSTGEFAATQAGGWTSLAEELQRLQPSEIVLPACLLAAEGWGSRVQSAVGAPTRLSAVPDGEATPQAARARLASHLSAETLAAHPIASRDLALAAAGAALFYLQDNQPNGESGPSLAHLRLLAAYDLADYVGLDAATRRNLELISTAREGRSEGSLLSVLDRTRTAMGARLLRRWVQQPLLDAERIRARLDAVEEMVRPAADAGQPGGAFLRGDLQKLLDGMHDVERLVGRIGFGSANARDLVALRRSLLRLPRVKATLAAAHAPRLQALHAALDELTDVADRIGAALIERPPILLREGGLFRPGVDASLDGLRDTAAQGRDWLAGLEAAERARLGIPNLRLKYNQVLGFYLEVTRSHLDKVPAEYVRRATVRSAERFVTAEIKAREAEILAAEDRADDLEYELFVGLRQQVASESERLLATARVLAELDVLAALADVAARQGYVRPEIDDGPGGARIDIGEGRHPVVERSLPPGEPFVPNDVYLDGEQRLLIITGPNMAGKSVLVRQVALIVLLAQMGSFVPARRARIGLADRIFTRVGASDDITRGRSTFFVEMSETAHILAQATPRSLVILDEVGRGTSTYDGMSLAWAVASDLHDRLQARCLFATHYHELTALPDHLPAARNYNMAVVERDGQVIFVRRLVPGGTDRSYGLHVARLAGVPQQVVDHAATVLARLEKGRGKRDSREWGSGDLEGEGIGEREIGEQESREWGSGEWESKHLERRGSGEQESGEGDKVRVMRERGADFETGKEQAGQRVLHEIEQVDIANLTPLQALIRLNEWQGRLKNNRQR